MQAGVVESIFLAAKAGGEPRAVSEARAVPGRGLEGDRYFRAGGTFSKTRAQGRHLTLIEAEALEALADEGGIELAAGSSRRNVVTRGLSLNDLVGKHFRIGEVECVGRMLCDPCRHLERLTQPGVLKGLAGRGGLRADILSEGRIAPGAAVSERSGG